MSDKMSDNAKTYHRNAFEDIGMQQVYCCDFPLKSGVK